MCRLSGRGFYLSVIGKVVLAMDGPPEPWAWLTTAKPLLASVALIVLWALESVAPAFLGRQSRTRHALSNLGLGVFNAVISAGLFGTALLAASEWSRTHHFGLLHWLNWPVLGQWLSGLILFDLWMYFWHRLNHQLPWLWRFHAVHHSDRELDASTALRFHTGEILLSGLARLALLPLIGLTMPQLLLYETLLLPIILFHHSNIAIPGRLDAGLRWLIPTPSMHWLHHSTWRPETNSNYGTILSLWDRLFGTYRLRDDPHGVAFGLLDDRDDRDDRAWRSLSGMLWRPFRRPGSARDK